jgi:hypothetical protein
MNQDRAHIRGYFAGRPNLHKHSSRNKKPRMQGFLLRTAYQNFHHALPRFGPPRK